MTPSVQPLGRLPRRAVLRGAGVALGAAALSGCTSVMRGALVGTPLDSKIVKYWNLFGGGDGVRMEQMVADYQHQHPNIDLRATTFSWGNPYYTKLTLGTLANQPPDVAICHLDRIVTPVDTGLLRPFEEEELEEFGLTESNILPAAWKAAHRNGRIWAIPLDQHPMAIYYNKQICDKAGLLDSSGKLAPIDGPKAFVDTLKAAQEVTKTFSGAIASDAAAHYRLFSSLFAQLGGEIATDEGNTIVLSRDAFMEATNWIRSLSHQEGVFPKNVDSASCVANFANQDSAFYFSGGFDRPTFIEAKVDFSLQAFPKIFDKHICWDGTHSFVIPRSDEAQPARITSGLHFIRGMMDRSLDWVEGGHLSTWLPVADGPQKKIKPHYETLPADGVAYDPPFWYAGSGSNMQTIIGSAVSGVTAGFSTPQEAYARAKAGLEELAATNAPH